jgi:hypothetical protein
MLSIEAAYFSEILATMNQHDIMPQKTWIFNSVFILFTDFSSLSLGGDYICKSMFLHFISNAFY